MRIPGVERKRRWETEDGESAMAFGPSCSERLQFEFNMHTVNEWILSIATVILAIATIGLVLYTKALSALTRELVSVERRRDERDERQRRLANVERGLGLVESLRDMKATDFASQLKGGTVPQPTARHIRDLALLAPRYIKDPDTVQNLRELRQWIDTVQNGGNIGDNEGPIAKTFRAVQDRSGWSITEWRDELEASSGAAKEP
jgi:hypothetical protein